MIWLFYDRALDISMVLKNMSTEEKTYRREDEEFLKRILSLPVSWEKDRTNYRFFMGDLVELLVEEGRREEAEQHAEQWRKTENPGTVNPEKGILWRLIRSDDPEMQKEAEEISDRILKKRTEFDPDEDLTLHAMALVYERQGKEEKAERVRELIRRTENRLWEIGS